MPLSHFRVFVKSLRIERYFRLLSMCASVFRRPAALVGLIGSCVVIACTLLLAQQVERDALGRTEADVARNSGGCVACHGMTDSPSMHTTGTVRLGCTDCHG